uniref:Uncharacterized protein n=1 Tax=Helicotheca tamesis TaxID=374047 RepID=A0A7S2II50_9STRA|mmetsp:Transcript_9659/g.13511  ORF Transcript_9659/g.13511 Transcript_9659/m.13511 type:complete len:150 (+) Transcript_9659:207-656(+)
MFLHFLSAALLICSCNALSFAKIEMLHSQQATSSGFYQHSTIPHGWVVRCKGSNPKSARNKNTALSYTATYQDKTVIGVHPDMAAVVSPTIIEAAVPERDDFILQDKEFLRALEAARDADSKYGICSPPSMAAWEAVDSMYERKLAFGA